jgi:hypothetical protein
VVLIDRLIVVVVVVHLISFHRVTSRFIDLSLPYTISKTKEENREREREEQLNFMLKFFYRYHFVDNAM